MLGEVKAMYKGRVIQGSWLPLTVRTKDSDGDPAAPTACPWVSMYDSAGALVARAKAPIVDAGAVVGLFQLSLFLGPDYDAGYYSVLYSWNVGSFHGSESDNFQVIPGGDGQGSVVSMYDYSRPHARFAVHQLDSGAIKRGRNPRVCACSSI